MKISRIVLALVLVLLAVQGLSLTAFAAGPAGTWASGIQIQNQSGTDPANITIDFYWSADSATPGAHELTFTDVVPAGGSKTYYVPAHIPGLSTNFVGSAVVGADQPIAAILNTTEVVSEADPKRLGSATGVLEPQTTMYAPYLRKDYYGRNSYIAVQNTTGSDNLVTVSYFDADGSAIGAATETATLPAFTSKVFYQDANANLPSSFCGSAIISGAAEIAVIVNNADSGASASQSGFESYNGLSTPATRLYMPKLTVNYYTYYQSSFTAQNTGASPATMTFTYTSTVGDVFVKTSDPIQPGAAWGPYLANEWKSGIPAGWSGTGSGVVTSDQPMVGIVTEVNTDTGYSVVWSAIPEGDSTDTILFPKFDRTYYDYNGGIQVQNLGDQPTTLVVTFSQPGRADVIVTSGTVDPGKSTYWYAPDVPGLTEWFFGSVTVVSVNGQPIAGVYTSRNDVASGDSYSAYNGIKK